MKTTHLAAALTASFALLAAPAQADQIYWTDWTAKTPGTPGSAIGSIALPGGTVDVRYSGEIFNAPDQGNWDQYLATYTSTAVDNAPSPANVSIQLRGNNSTVNTLTFSAPLLNPVMAIQSLGQGSDPATYDFGNYTFTLLSQGPGHWAGCATCLSVNGSTAIGAVGTTLVGREGNGTIQFLGTYSSISWTASDGENYHMFTIGAPVPEPETYAMLLAGLGLMGGIARRRKARSA